MCHNHPFLLHHTLHDRRQGATREGDMTNVKGNNRRAHALSPRPKPSCAGCGGGAGGALGVWQRGNENLVQPAPVSPPAPPFFFITTLCLYTTHNALAGQPKQGD